MGQNLTVHTIGHSNHSIEEFVALLKKYAIQVVVDVRSAPYSRFAPHFNQTSLELLLNENDLQYLFAGKFLGGRPTDPACYRDGVVPVGKADYLALVDYPAVAQQEWYQRGVRRLLDIAAEQATAVMCSEEDPRRCHRHHLIEHSLREHGVSVQHIRRNGMLDPTETDPSPSPAAQLALQGIDA